VRTGTRYALRRIAMSLPVIFGVVVLTFLLLRLVPGNPAQTLLGIHASPSAVAALQRQLGLDEPIYRQFWHYFDGLLHGYTGMSIYYQVSTSSLIGERIGLTAALVGVSALFTVVITVPIAAFAAARKNRAPDHAARVVSLVGLGLPSFWFGIVLILIFSVKLGWFPVGGWGTTPLQHLRALVLPGITAAIGICPVLIRSLRAGMLEVIESDFVAVARAKGIRGSRVLFVHVVRNALIPTVTLLGINIAYLIGGTVVIEQVFDLNGLGNLMLTSIDNRDFPVVQGVTLVYAIAVVAINVLTDLVSVRLDPRVHLE